MDNMKKIGTSRTGDDVEKPALLHIAVRMQSGVSAFEHSNFFQS